MIRRFLLVRRISEPGCGRCGYPVRGLTGTTCPECGADQAHVGVVQPIKPWRGWGTFGWMLAWVAVVITLARVGNQTLLVFMPGDISNQREYQLRPNSGVYHALTVYRTGYEWGWLADRWIPATPKQSVLVASAAARAGGEYLTEFTAVQGGQFYFSITHRGAMKVSRPSNPQGPPLDQASVLEWMSLLDIDTNRPDVRTEAHELAQLMQSPDLSAAHHERLTGFTVLSSTQSIGIRRSQGVLILLWIIIGLLGMWTIAIVRRRRSVSSASTCGDAGSVLATR